MHGSAQPRPYPSHKITAILFILLGITALGSMALLLSVTDTSQLKGLIEDSGPVQMVGQTAIALAFAISLYFVLADNKRRSAYLSLSYLLLFYTLREADYHYKLSEHAKASQFKRFFSHEMIPLSSKLFLAAIVILFLTVFYRYLRDEKAGFLRALRDKLPWALITFAWAGVAFLSQLIDQLPVFHTVTGQVFEEIFESTAEILVLMGMIVFRIQIWGDGAVRLSENSRRR